MPLVTDRVTRSGLAPASTSLTLRALPLALENTRVVSSLTDCAVGTVCTGASLTALTVMATVSLSVSVPPAPVLPWSDVVKLRVALPLYCAVGV